MKKRKGGKEQDRTFEIISLRAELEIYVSRKQGDILLASIIHYIVLTRPLMSESLMGEKYLLNLAPK